MEPPGMEPLLIPRERSLSEERKRQIFLAAMEVFDEHGFERAKVEDVATRAGLARATIYYHFRSKRDLFVFLLRQGIEELGSAVEAAVSLASSPLEALEALIDSHVDFYSANQGFARLVLTETWRASPAKELAPAQLLTHDLVVALEVFEKAEAAGILRQSFSKGFLVSGFYGLIAATAVYFITFERDLEPDSLKRDLRELLLHGALDARVAARPPGAGAPGARGRSARASARSGPARKPGNKP